MKISKQKKDKISEQILSILFDVFPSSLFTAHIARETARDEEFIKSLLFELNEQGLVIPIKKSSDGLPYSRRIRWRISNKAQSAYKQQLSRQ